MVEHHSGGTTGCFTNEKACTYTIYMVNRLNLTVAVRVLPYCPSLTVICVEGQVVCLLFVVLLFVVCCLFFKTKLDNDML